MNGWGDLIPVSPSSGRHTAPVAVELANETCLVFWCQVPGQGRPSAIRMRKVDASANEKFAESFVVSGEVLSRYPSAAVDSAGAVWLAWQSEEGSAGEAIYVAARRAGPP